MTNVSGAPETFDSMTFDKDEVEGREAARRQTQSRAERLPRRYSNVSGGMPERVRKSLQTICVLSLLRRILVT